MQRMKFVHGHLFVGIGMGALGFQKASARLGNLELEYVCAGGIDVDAGAIKAFEHHLGVPGTVKDLFSREQYMAFHGHEPPADWREATPDDVLRAMRYMDLDCCFLSAPCKGFSGLTSESRSKTEKYQALNQLAVRGLLLLLEAYKGRPIPFILFENVPRIQTRGRYLLDQITQVLHSYGYAVAETTHDCGELGELAQRRKRCLLVARHMEKIPPFLYEPEKKPLISVGRLLEKFPLPGDTSVVGPMHRIPALHWKTWVRLAFVEAGSDWRSLQKLAVQNGYLRDFAIMPEAEYHAGILGVNRWDDASGTVTGNARPVTGSYSVADPRIDGHDKSVQMGVRTWEAPSGVVTGKMFAGGGPNSVADPRIEGVKHNNCFRIARWADVSNAVTAGTGPSAGGLSVADPRPPSCKPAHVDDTPYRTQGHYGVVPWDSHSGAVTAHGQHDNGPHSVADPRLPASGDRLVCVIRALDNTWHRPFTTLELAALQGLADPDKPLWLPGHSDSQHREWIGNGVPPPAARAVASCMGHAKLLAMNGETFMLSAMPIWVQPHAIAIAVATRVPA